jgi:ankyrin repeat protein
MPAHPLPNDSSFEHLRKQAKRLHAAVLAGSADALAQVAEFHPREKTSLTRFSLSDAQLVIARTYGFSSWAKLKQHLASIEPFLWNPRPIADQPPPDEVFVRLACLAYDGWRPSNQVRAARMLADHPELARASIYAAVAAGDVATVQAMVDRNPVLVNMVGGPDRWQPLLYACYSRMAAADGNHSTLEVARLLLSRGADPNAGFLWAGNYAFTALTGAFGRGEDWPNQPPHPQCEALARLLLEAGADPNDSQALYNRHFEENDDHLKLLFEYGLGRDKGGPWLKRLNDPRLNPSSLLVIELCAAASHGFFGRVKLLVEHGVDVNARGLRNNRTAYEEALRAGRHAVADYLLEHGATKIELDPLETFALACIEGRRDDVRARLAEDPTLLDRIGHKGRVDLLHRALDAKQRAGLRLIVELGVDINGMVPGTGLDRSVLHNAAGWGGLEMVKFLLDLGADPNLRDPTFHATPIGWALHNHQQDVVEHLLPFATIFEAVLSGSVERAAELLTHDASAANAVDPRGYAVVFYLPPEMTRLEEMLDLLIAHGADLNARGPNGKTNLDRALAEGWTEFADTLRVHGARTAAEMVMPPG